MIGQQLRDGLLMRGAVKQYIHLSGFNFKVAGGLMTNFHHPSTLMLVIGVNGADVKANHAILKNIDFSYGDHPFVKKL